METTRPDEDDDAFALRLSWDESGDEGRDPDEPSPRHRLEGPPNGSASSTEREAGADPIGPGVHDLVTRVELRQIGVAIGELRREVADLRTGMAALLDDRVSPASDPSLEDVRADIAALRDELSLRLPEVPGSVVPELQPVVDEIVALRAEVVALKRRIAVRASAAGDATGDQADQIARLVAERLAGLPPKPAR